MNSTIIDNIDFKRDLEIANKLYRDIELSYFERKIEFLNKKTEENFKDFEESLKEITGNTVFNIASVFLGISLTSALVSGVQFIEKDLIILYFLTCLLIITVTIGVTAIFIRKADKKSYFMLAIIFIVSALWLCAFFNYNSHPQINEVTKNDLVNEKQ